MKSLALSLLPGLIASFSAYGGVTESGVTAYVWGGDASVIVFTDDPAPDPLDINGPLGVGALKGGNQCDALKVGSDGIPGLHCTGETKAPVSTYTCTSSRGGTNAASNFWCLFSENPRTGDKAWAVKYVSGEIPSDDGLSIVRCEGTDIFDSTIGCRPAIAEISVTDGYIKPDTTEGDAPPDIDCSLDTDIGRMIVDDVNADFYVCTNSGWIIK